MKPQPFVALAVASGHAAAVAAAATSADKVESDFQLPAGFAIHRVAAEPDLANSMTLCVDEVGAVFVSEAHTYRYGPQGSPVQPPSNPIKRIEVGSDGRAALPVSPMPSGLAAGLTAGELADLTAWLLSLK